MKIAIDKEIFGYHDFFSSCKKINDIFAFDAIKIKNKDLIKYDALFVRSVTPVNKLLLKNTNIQFVATATSGTDHLDINYFKKKKISFSSAHGANANSVVQYIFSNILFYCWQNNKKINNLSIAVIGCGKVGSKLVSLLKTFQVKVYPIDPFVENCLKEFPYKKKIDIISLNCSLTKKGNFPSYQLINKNFLQKLQAKITIINTSRGEVVNENDLINSHRIQFLFNDVWQNEPDINPFFLEKCHLATPHIAGYSVEAKLRATKMIYYSFCDFFSLPLPKENIINKIFNSKKIIQQQKISLKEIKKKIEDKKNQNQLKKNCNIYYQDHHQLLDAMKNKNIIKIFSQRRKEIISRREFFYNDIF